MKRFSHTLILMIVTTIFVAAQELTDSVTIITPTIADRLNESDDVKITQPSKLNLRLIKAKEEPKPESDAQATTVSGYRIQAFSGNNARTAKRDADNRAMAISEKFPEYATYVTFDAPYWRLKIGDFSEYEDAAVILSELKREFPSFARELRLVRDKIKVSE